MKAKKEQEYVSLPWFGMGRLLPYLRPYRGRMTSMVTLGLFAGLIDIVLPLFQKYALDRYVAGQTLDGLPFFILAYAAALLLQVIANTVACFQAGKVEMYVGRDMKRAAFDHLQTLSFSYYNQNSVGYIHSRVMSDTSRIGGLVSWSLMDGVWNLTYLVGAIVMMLVINARLSLLVLILVPLTFAAAAFFQKRLVHTNRRVREINSQITGRFNEGITGAKTTKSLVVEERMTRDFEETSRDMTHTSLRAARYRAMFGSMISFSGWTALALVLWRGGSLTMSGLIVLGTLSVFMTYAINMMEPIQWVVRAISDLITVQVNVERFTRLVETPSDVRDTPEVIARYGDTLSPKRENWEPLHGEVEFRDVSFCYPDGDD